MGRPHPRSRPSTPQGHGGVITGRPIASGSGRSSPSIFHGITGVKVQAQKVPKGLMQARALGSARSRPFETLTGRSGGVANVGGHFRTGSLSKVESHAARMVYQSRIGQRSTSTEPNASTIPVARNDVRFRSRRASTPEDHARRYPTLHLDMRGADTSSSRGGSGTGVGSGIDTGPGFGTGAGGAMKASAEDEEDEEDTEDLDDDDDEDAPPVAWQDAVLASQMPEVHGNYYRIFPVVGDGMEQEKLAGLLKSAEVGNVSARKEREREREAEREREEKGVKIPGTKGSVRGRSGSGVGFR